MIEWDADTRLREASLPPHKETDTSSPQNSLGELKAFICGSSIFLFYWCHLVLVQSMCSESDELICTCYSTHR